MHRDQIHVDVDIARRLVNDNFPRLHGEPVRAVESSGTMNAIYRVGDHAAARFPVTADDVAVTEERLRKETAAMTEFSRCCPFPTPLPLGIGRPGWSYPLPWSMQTWVNGEVATPTGLAASEPFARDLASLLQSLRGADTRGRPFDGEGRGGVIGDQDDWMTTCFDHSGGLLDVPTLRSVWNDLRSLPPAQANVMCHKDLTPPNILVEGERIVGVLDTGGFGPADPALDLVSVWHLLDENGRGLVRRRLQIADDEWLRGAAWAFAQAMGLVWYYQHSNPAMSALGKNTLERLVAEAKSG